MDMLGDIIQSLVNFYIENSMKDNILTITNRKLLLPHLNSLLRLTKGIADDEFKKVTNLYIASYKVILCIC